ncbi:translation initiation factor eIF-2B subunit alpha-like [Penaeus chinensis]|uniref:translation initiation factor eIF-2B subunit alpha-like n=1 Tax=Penaeus chinensis TaxID=139456 RepID=UPI001FB5E620|nr:translation initiation factor eIF-2B subunit alpha-like [Penaeus chinensis]
MKPFDISTYFLEEISKDEDMSPAIAAMKALTESLRMDDSTTLQEFIEKMKVAREALSRTDVSVVSVSSGCELFMRFITLSHLELEQATDFASCREILLRRGEDFVSSMQESRKKILRSSHNLIKDGMVILTHSKSRNVLAVMAEAARQGRQFKVFVTESQPDRSGKRMAEDLRAAGIPCTVILDAAVGYVMEQVTMVMLGAEGVCENGGIINKIGSYSLATLAHMKHKPVYVLVESYKFLRTIPLNNASLPKSYLYKSSVLNSGEDLIPEHPLVDYTPPDNITLLYTDLGVLPTSAITEHLIKLYT